MKTMAIMENGSPKIFNARYVINHSKRLVHSNPTEDQLRDCGYKEYIKTENTLEEKEGFYITVIYTETDEQIIEGYDYVKLNEENIKTPIDENAFEIEDSTSENTEEITDETI